LSNKSKQIIRITLAFLNGSISNGDRERLVDAIRTSEPELPLGIGSTTEAPKN